MYTHIYDSNSPFHSIYTCAMTPSFACSLHSFSYKEFSQRIIEPLMAERMQVSIYSFMQLIIKFFVIIVTKISSNIQRAIIFL